MIGHAVTARVVWSSFGRDPPEDVMVKLIVFVGATVGSYAGWYLGERFGFMTAFMLSMVGTGVGMYYGNRFARDRFG